MKKITIRSRIVLHQAEDTEVISFDVPDEYTPKEIEKKCDEYHKEHVIGVADLGYIVIDPSSECEYVDKCEKFCGNKIECDRFVPICSNK